MVADAAMVSVGRDSGRVRLGIGSLARVLAILQPLVIRGGGPGSDDGCDNSEEGQSDDGFHIGEWN